MGRKGDIGMGIWAMSPIMGDGGKQGAVYVVAEGAIQELRPSGGSERREEFKGNVTVSVTVRPNAGYTEIEVLYQEYPAPKTWGETR